MRKPQGTSAWDFTMAVLYDILTLWPLALYAAFFYVFWRYGTW